MYVLYNTTVYLQCTKRRKKHWQANALAKCSGQILTRNNQPGDVCQGNLCLFILKFNGGHDGSGRFFSFRLVVRFQVGWTAWGWGVRWWWWWWWLLVEDFGGWWAAEWRFGKRKIHTVTGVFVSGAIHAQILSGDVFSHGLIWRMIYRWWLSVKANFRSRLNW